MDLQSRMTSPIRRGALRMMADWVGVDLDFSKASSAGCPKILMAKAGTRGADS